MSVSIKRHSIITILLFSLLCSSCMSSKTEQSNAELSGMEVENSSIDISIVETGDLLETFEDLLGQGSCRVDLVRETGLSNEVLLFVRNRDDRIIAECSRPVFNENEAYYIVDIDKNYKSILICNCQYATGAERVLIYRNNNDSIECGHVREEYICRVFNLQSLASPYSFSEKYDSEKNVIIVILFAQYYEEYSEDQVLEIKLNDIEAVEYMKYDYME